MDKMSQRIKILNYCREHGSITIREAFDNLYINSPTKRISELKAMGYDVQTADEVIDRGGETVKFRRYYIGGVV